MTSEVTVDVTVNSPGSVPAGSVFLSVDRGPAETLLLEADKGEGVTQKKGLRLSIGVHRVTAGVSRFRDACGLEYGDSSRRQEVNR